MGVSKGLDVNVAWPDGVTKAVDCPGFVVAKVYGVVMGRGALRCGGGVEVREG